MPETRDRLGLQRPWRVLPSSALPLALACLLLTSCSEGAASTAGVSLSRPGHNSLRSTSQGQAVPRLFAGQLLVYAFHGFTRAEVATVRSAVRGTVTAVYAGEVAVASGQPAYPEIAVETLTADPGGYAAATGRPDLAARMRTGLVLSSSGARLRRVGAGGGIPLVDGRRLPVTAVVDDHVIGGYEMATSPGVLGQEASSSANYLLVSDDGDANKTAVAVRRTLPRRTVRVKRNGDNGFMSSVDTTLTQAQLKLQFGEFAMRRLSDGYLEPDPGWTKTWIETMHVPQLGMVACHRAVLTELTAAMREVTDEGLGWTVHTADFIYEGGCYSPRTVPFARGGALSAHSWGVAIDINVDANPLGAPPLQNARLVKILARHGFSWGGRWLRPDGAHFEWVGTAVPQQTLQ